MELVRASRPELFRTFGRENLDTLEAALASFEFAAATQWLEDSGKPGADKHGE